MAADNRSLGKFLLGGIPPAPRGVPQIEVSFDIDANGILNVGAKDMGTGKSHSIRIEASSGLKKDEVERMRRDAEEHAEDDRARKELAEARNKAEQLIYTVTKTLEEHGSKASKEEREEIQAKVKVLEEARKGEDAAKITSAMEDLMRASHKLAEEVYRKAAESKAAEEGAAKEPSKAGGKPDEKIIDADYEVK
jgi:molecular chaperone DnaK